MGWGGPSAQHHHPADRHRHRLRLTTGRRGTTSLVTDRLCVAVADLHNLAGWTSFDTGQVRVARTHFGHARALAKEGHDYALVANIRYRTGRVHLHHNAPGKALTEFQLGQVAAHASGSALAVAILYANQAWAYAKMGLDDEALALLGRSTDEFARADLAEAPARQPEPRHSKIATPRVIIARHEWG